MRLGVAAMADSEAGGRWTSQALRLLQPTAEASPLNSIAPVVEQQPSAPPLVSVVICTYRRYDYLERLIPKAAALRVKGQPIEVLIVDSTDDERVAEEFFSRSAMPSGVRMVRSTPAGLSRARNVGLRECRSPYALFLDDDAEPAEGWAEAIFNVFEAYPGAAVVGGPIVPLWPQARPAWLSSRFEGCLTMLDAGPSFRRFTKDYEHVYGANIAVHVERALEVGGFEVSFGRQKAFHLLSNEELVLQNQLRNHGYHVYYAPEALVFHHVHPDRLSQSWIRRRMAWQAVSDAMSWDTRPEAAAILGRATGAAARLGLDPSFLKLFEPVAEPGRLDAQVELIMALMETCLLSNAELSTAQVQSLGAAVLAEPAPKPGHLVRTSSLPALGLKAGGALFVEATPGHDYLFDAYQRMENTSILRRDLDPWRGDEEGIRPLLALLDDAIRAVQQVDGVLVLLTMDYWARPNVVDQVARRLLSAGVPVAAMLHRFPSEPSQIRCVRELAQVVDKVIVLSPDFRMDLERKYGIENVEYLPHHPPTETYPLLGRAQARAKVLVPDDRHVIGTIGEIRAGKGLEPILEAIRSLDQATRDKAFFLFAGKSPPEARQEVQETLRQCQALGRVDLRQTPDRRVFALLNEFEYADYVSATDTGVLFYQGAQRAAMSGVLPCYVASGSGVIATANSYVGRLVADYDLGYTVADETGAGLAAAIAQAVEAGRPVGSELRAIYRARVSVEAVNSQFAALLKDLRGLTP